MWVHMDDVATSTGFTLEVTLREDLNGDGYADDTGEDMFRLDTTFTSADYTDTWVQVKAPLTDLIDLNAGVGDGTFDGKLDQIVLVVTTVQGGAGANVEVDFDYLTFIEGTPPPVVIEDFNDATANAHDGDPANWEVFGAGGGGAGTDNPHEGTHALQTGWGGDGGGAFYGGVWKDLDNAAQIMPPSNAEFSMWGSHGRCRNFYGIHTGSDPARRPERRRLC